MRHIIDFSSDWSFSKEASAFDKLPHVYEKVDLPHTWNAKDGQDGGGDYYRGKCVYAKYISKSSLPSADAYYLEICGANSSAEVYINGECIASHHGGYSAWRINITEHLSDKSLLVIAVDNSPNDHVYPQMADFTFYGGLYRDVNIICVGNSRFDLDCFGGPGIKVTPSIAAADARIEIETFVTGKKAGQEIRFTIYDAAGSAVASEVSSENKTDLLIKNVHLWHGRRDPYLYTAKTELMENGAVIDCVSARFGCRTYEIDPERGFILNGEEYPLRGVSRHQDRLGIGNALHKEHHLEDMDMICEVGANTIRLAHYQHDQYFYDLCDERGMIIWAEIPYISKHLPGGVDNTVSQMKELIVQNYNHPSIVVWGLSNEITISGSDPELIENHRLLNDLCHRMDPTRKTVLACVSMCDINDPYIQIPDVISYNHYFGWYGGDVSMNGPWFDMFHAAYPDIPIGCSEYGCEALNWHNSTPRQGDYTEEYQAYYHEELIKQLYSRKYIWATHVWNMFDFGADARSEGGEAGQNHKGLVTFDRKYKKDSFYAYKAWLSDEPFVHICGKRYIDRVEDITKVTIYSNQPEVELFANGISLGKRTASDHFFRFEVPITAETRLTAVAGACTDESFIRKTEKFNDAYHLKDESAVLNWFDITEKEGFLSLNDKVSVILATEGGRALIGRMIPTKEQLAKQKTAGFEISAEAQLNMLMGFTLLRLTGMLAQSGHRLTKEELLALNAKLNEIPKN